MMNRLRLCSAALVVASSAMMVSGFVPLVVPTSTTTTNTALAMARQVNRGRRGAPVLEKKPPMNGEIEAQELRVVTPQANGKDEALGIMSREEALAKAQEMGGLDLILVNANSDPPVCKIADYSKYRYMQEKKAKELKKNSKATEIKEVKMSYKIDIHDYGVRKKSALKFLKEGNRVKCTVMFRGREVQHDNLGFDLLEKMANELDELCTKEGRPKREGRNLAMILSPRTEVLKAVNDKRRQEDKAKKQAKKQAFEEKQASKSASSASGIDVVEAALNEREDNIIDMESSLDELLGGSDDLTDDIFS